jgi:excisionase family DNA binding protein
MSINDEIARREADRQASFRGGSAAPLPQLLTLKEFCRATATAESTVRGWISEGRLTALSANGFHLRIPVSEIERVFRPIVKTKGAE